METIEGMSYIKLYKNKACTREIEKDIGGNYIFNVNKISNNAHNPFTFTFYARNIGSHKAYDFKLTEVSSTIPFTIVSQRTDITSTQICYCKLLATIPTGNSEHSIVVKVEYENV